MALYKQALSKNVVHCFIVFLQVCMCKCIVGVLQYLCTCIYVSVYSRSQSSEAAVEKYIPQLHRSNFLAPLTEIQSAYHRNFVVELLNSRSELSMPTHFPVCF